MDIGAVTRQATVVDRPDCRQPGAFIAEGDDRGERGLKGNQQTAVTNPWVCIRQLIHRPLQFLLSNQIDPILEIYLQVFLWPCQFHF